MDTIIVVLVTIFLLALAWFSIEACNGGLWRNRMINTRRINSQAKIVDVKKPSYSPVYIRNYEVTVHFSDGSWYRESIGKVVMFGLRRSLVQIDQAQVNKVIENAIKAHEKVALKREKPQRKREYEIQFAEHLKKARKMMNSPNITISDEGHRQMIALQKENSKLYSKYSKKRKHR